MDEDWRNEITLKMVTNKIGVDYDVLEYLGGGGLARIYTVRHKILDEVQALKIMDFNYILQIFEKTNVKDIDQEFEKIKNRFINEAKIYRKLSHPNIIKIHKIGFVKYETRKIEIPYLIMEYVKGRSLKKILKEKSSLGMKRILKISENILSALDTIHQEGVIHRDIKPSNIMIKEESGEVVLIDFGLAKDIKNSKGITVSRTAMGTLNYMSPEMFRNSKGVSIEADIYSFGVVLYEMITGEVPFSGSFPEVMHGHLNIIKSIPEELALKNPRLAKGINKIIKKAMAKDVKDRYRGAEDFLNELKELEAKLNDKDLEKGLNKEERPQKNLIKYLLIIFGIIALAAFFVINPFKSPGKNELQYKRYIESANKFIQKNDFKKATDFLNKAKEIKDSKEVKQLSETIAEKQREIMKRDFGVLKAFLIGDAAKSKKVEKCREFLNNHQSVPKNDETTSIISETNKFITQLVGEIRAGQQYQNYIASAKNYIEKGQYQKAADSLSKAKKIKDTEEVKQLSKTIAKKQQEESEFERINGGKE